MAARPALVSQFPRERPGREASPVKILALGSPHGDDRVAWHVADRLRADARVAGLVHQLATPWELLDHAEIGTRLLILDACRSGRAAATVICRTGREIDDVEESSHSTHEGGLRTSLQLARRLERIGDETTVIAVEIENAATVGPTSASFDAAAAALEAAVRRRLSEWAVIE